MRLRLALAAALACAAAASAAAIPAVAQSSRSVPRPILDLIVSVMRDEDYPDAAALAPFVEISRRHELNGDRRAEYFVRGTGPFCGASGNCREWVFTRTADGHFRLLLDVAGKALVPRRSSTNGWLDLSQDGHFSAYETTRDGFQYDRRRAAYLATQRELHVSDGAARRVAYRVRMPLAPRQVVLEPVETGAAGARLSGSYLPCSDPTPGRLCGTPNMLLTGMRATGRDDCVTLELGMMDGTASTARARCTIPSGGGGVAMNFDAADWMRIAQAMEIRLRAPGVDVKLPDGSQMGLTAFAVEVLEMNGIDPYPDDES